MWIGIHVGSLGFCFIVNVIIVARCKKFFIRKLEADLGFCVYFFVVIWDCLC